MAVYYYKGMKILAPFSIYSNEPHFDVTTISLKTQRISQGHQRWELSFSVQPDQAEPQDLFADMLSSDQFTSDTMIMPQFKAVVENTTATGTVTISSNSEVGQTSVTLNSSSASGIIPKGAFFKFDNHNKVYILTQEADFSGASTTLNFYPTLKANVTTANNVRFKELCTFTYYRDISTSTQIQFTDGILANPGVIKLFEAV